MAFVEMDFASGGSGGGSASYDLSTYDEIITGAYSTATITTQKKARYIIILCLVANSYPKIMMYDSETENTYSGYFSGGSFVNSGKVGGVSRLSDTAYSISTGSSTAGASAIFIYHEK